MFARSARLTAPGIIVLATSVFAVLLAGFVLLVKFAAHDPQVGSTLRSHASADQSSLPQPPTWGGPSEGKEGQTWTHKELFAYLNSRGMRWYFHETAYLSDRGPAVHCLENPSDDQAAFIRNELAGDDGTNHDYTFVQKLASANQAKDVAGAKEGAFSWGRFLFISPEPSLSRLRAALGASGH